MTAFLLLWDGSDAGYHPDEYRRDQDATSRGELTHGRWSFGRRVKGAEPGDRVFLLKQHSDRGIVASGRLQGRRGIYQAPHWDTVRGGTTRYVDVEWDAVVALDDRLSTEVLLDGVPEFKWNYVRASGQELTSPADARVEALWTRHLNAMTPGGASYAHFGAAASLEERRVQPGDAQAVGLEATNTQDYEVGTSTTVEALRREGQLVERMRRHLEAGGHRVGRYRIALKDGRHLFTDIADFSDNVLWEAKGVATREAVRTAIGQLMDYQRFIQPPPRMAVLLPERPDPDLQTLLSSIQIELWYEDGDRFVRA